MKIYTNSYSGTEKKLIMRIKKMNAYVNSNRADTGLFLFESVVSSMSKINRRLVEIKCSLYNETLMLSATDLIPNLSNLGIYFVEEDETVAVYVSSGAYANVSMTVITCDNPSIYDFTPYSIETMADDATYTQPTELGSVIEVKYTLGDNMTATSASMTCNKLFYNHNTKTVDGEIIIAPSATGSQTILTCDGLVQSTNANEGLIYTAYAWVASDGTTVDSYEIFPVTWDRTNHKLTGKIPTNTTRIVLPIHTYLAEGLLS